MLKYWVGVAAAAVLVGCVPEGEVYQPEYAQTGEQTAADLLPENTAKTKENEAYAGRANATCVTEANVDFVPTPETKLTTAEIKALLTGNTILSADQDGVFAIYYSSATDTVGWMPKKTTLQKPDWNVGSVSFENDQYCRTWDYWNGGKETCWDIHKGGERLGASAFYFICGNGGVAGDQHVVLKGNALGVAYEGTSNKNGVLTQDEKAVGKYVPKYFGNYKFK